MRWAARALAAPVRLYQAVRAGRPSPCRYQPTCSTYALEALEAHGLTPADVDLFVNHQANKRIDDRFADSLGVPQEKVVSTIAKYGNTSAATIPLGLWEARIDGRLKPGMLVCSAAFGAGFTWASALYRW